MKMTHADLCKKTAEWAIKPPDAAWLALYEYQSFASQEFPDVLTYSSSGTRLYEIKMSRSDFLADAKKEARKKWKPMGYLSSMDSRERQYWIDRDPKLYYIENPHLGSLRYFVCEEGLISPNEIYQGWGLIWYSNGKFIKKIKSQSWRPDVHTERDLAAHALRRYASGDSTGILIHTY